ncbi:MAG: methylated-DNA--[protein]-cysteine S-methyltransferase [Clostridiales bacterium]|jgi:methylated-DNA-[protein]-cysteine S-methyltransferase|nr:methylated-DNA--[protein]-cysteine S-methyltransferase [Clostridiales bacterium]
MYYATTYASPIGPLTLACDSGGEALTGLFLERQKYRAETMPGAMAQKDDLPIFNAAKKWLDAYFARKNPAISELALDPAGGEFRRAVWRLLCEIPYGHVRTYGDIAKSIAAQLHKTSMSSQAVGGAVGHNPISIIIPCHRVVGANGNLTGYASGIGIKIKLLHLEGVDMSKMFVPTKGKAL